MKVERLVICWLLGFEVHRSDGVISQNQMKVRPKMHITVNYLHCLFRLASLQKWDKLDYD